MAVMNAYDTYQTNHFEGMDAKQLILKLYDGALKHTRLAMKGIEEGNIRKRGENLGKVIAIVSELNACLDPQYQDESIGFLRGLYAAILAELPKVSITNDKAILTRTESYIGELRRIWKNSVMGRPAKPETDTNTQTGPAAPASSGNAAAASAYASNSGQYKPQSFTV